MKKLAEFMEWFLEGLAAGVLGEEALIPIPVEEPKAAEEEAFEPWYGRA